MSLIRPGPWSQVPSDGREPQYRAVPYRHHQRGGRIRCARVTAGHSTEVRLKHPNFKEYVGKNVEVFVSSTAVVNVVLEVGSTTEMITVEAQEVQVETTTGAVGNVVEGREVRELPLNGRSFVQLNPIDARRFPAGGLRLQE